MTTDPAPGDLDPDMIMVASCYSCAPPLQAAAFYPADTLCAHLQGIHGVTYGWELRDAQAGSRPVAASPSGWREADRMLGHIRYADAVTPDEVEWMLAHVAWLHGEVDRLSAAGEASAGADLRDSGLHLVLCLLDARAMKDDETAADCADLARRLRGEVLDVV